MADASDLRRRLRQARDRSVAEAARATVADLRQGLWRDTGDTAERTKVESIRSTAATTTATIMTPTPQANYQEYGTRPHVIRPRRRKALRFVTGGQVVFAQKVNHPGNKARPRFFPIIKREWPRHLQRAWRRNIR